MKKTITICDFCKDIGNIVIKKCKYCKKDFCKRCCASERAEFFNKNLFSSSISGICVKCYNEVKINLTNFNKLKKKLSKEILDYIKQVRTLSNI